MEREMPEMYDAEYAREELEQEALERDEYVSDEDDGQPSEYTEWQDYMGGDDWDQGQYDDGEY